MKNELGVNSLFLTDRIVAEKNKLSVEMNPIPADTTIDASRKQFEILRRLRPEVRLKMAFEMSDNLHSIVESGVRGRNPGCDEQKIKQEVLRLMIGERLFREIVEEGTNSE
jgi:hypothetical protein